MKDDSTEQVQALVTRISAQLDELAKLTDDPEPSELRPPATAQQIAAFERKRGVTLPDDYKAFLLLHNGWARFNGDNALLSLEEMSDGPIADGLRELQGELRRVGNQAAADGLVFEGSLGIRISYFDVDRKKKGGNLDVVFWDVNEVGRFATFTEFLQDYSKTLAQMISDERDKLR